MLISDASSRRSKGFTLIELMVTVVLLAILMALALPSIAGWIRNNKIRTVSDSLQNGLRTAQAEASRRSRQVVFSLTTAKPVANGYTASQNGSNWAISTVPSTMASEASEFIESGVLADANSAIQITGPAAICFGALGRLVDNTSPGVAGANCARPAAPATPGPSVQRYDITVANAVSGVDRPLRVLVALGGQVRLCDPAKTLSDSDPDGCPP